MQRLRAMAALTCCAPLQGGDRLIAEVYSPHLDIYQRLLVLDVLGAAAQVGGCGDGGRALHQRVLQSLAGGTGRDKGKVRLSARTEPTWLQSERHKFIWEFRLCLIPGMYAGAGPP
jgi:hypothetical protein